jgi:hypothetical protein
MMSETLQGVMNQPNQEAMNVIDAFRIASAIEEAQFVSD